MFKKFSSEGVSSHKQITATRLRQIRLSLTKGCPGIQPVLDDLLPMEGPVIVARCQGGINLVLVNSVPLFFNIRNGPYMPTLRLLHQYPNIMKKLQVHRGAIKFVLGGANLTCLCLTYPGGALDDEVKAETPVAIMAEGKQHALAIGFTKMSTKDIRTINRGIAIDNMHFLNDGLWKEQVVTLKESCKAVKKKKATLINWQRPAFGWIKLNVDAGFKLQTGQASFGAVARDHEGKVLFSGASSSPYAASAAHAEMQAIFFGLKIARTLQGGKLVVETDSLLCIQALCEGENSDMDLRGLVVDILEMIKVFGNCYFVHVKRDGNQLAHMLAKMYDASGSESIWQGSLPPSCINPDI